MKKRLYSCFEELAGGFYIGSHPTAEHNRYMVIRFDFSKMVMADTIEGLKQNFNDLNCDVIAETVEAKMRYAHLSMPRQYLGLFVAIQAVTQMPCSSIL